MVHSARSRPVAISTRCAPTRRSVGWSAAARRARTVIARAAVGTRAAVRPWSAVRAVTSACRLFSLVTIALGADDDPTALDHRAVDARDYAGRVGLRDLDEGMALPQIAFADVIAGNPSFARDDSHQVADFDAVPGPDGHEETRHSGGATP